MTDRLRVALRVVVGGLAALLLLAPPALAQTGPPDRPQHNLDAFEPVDFPDPTRFRAADGRPGADYWQNAADYRIDVRLDTARHRLSGTQAITYTNNAPQPLSYLWVQLDQNLFRPDSRGASVVEPGARFSGFFRKGGYAIDRVTVLQGGAPVASSFVVDGTRMRVDLSEPLAANGGTLTLELEWSFTIPPYGADRMGRLDVEQGRVYQLAQWFPRMSVYDDVHGWNPLPYLGQGEYYLEYGDYTINITVPRGYLVASTGTLQNPDEVLTDAQQARLDRARSSREPVTIVGEDAVGTDATRPDGEGPLTWRYRAASVRDVAWTASDAFLWDAAAADAGGETVLAQSFYPREGLGSSQSPGWEESTRYVQHSVEFYSETYSPYPYPNAINVAGIVRGMEYPQIVFCSVNARGKGLFGVTDHEFGHTWFPMVVGSDERRWAWMDEGLNSFLGVYSEDAFYDASTAQSLTSLSQRTASVMRSGLGNQPIMTYADRIRPNALGFLAYRKPANGLVLLREYVIGPDLFDAAFRAYIDRWAYKHPKPADFFRTMEDVTGQDLDWFWRSWFYETDVMDHAVADVTSAQGDAETKTLIHLEQRGDLMMPMQVTLAFADGTTETRRVPAEAFFASDRHTLVVTDRTVDAVTLDADRLLPDVNRRNNTWSRTDASDDNPSDGGASDDDPSDGDASSRR